MRKGAIVSLILVMVVIAVVAVGLRYPLWRAGTDPADLGADLAPGYGLLYVGFPHSAPDTPTPPGDFCLSGTLYAAVPWNAPGIEIMEDVSGGVAWDPGGEEALVVRTGQGNSEPSLVLVPVDGSPATVVTMLPAPDFTTPHDPGFSPGGGYLTVLDGPVAGTGPAMETRLHILDRSGEVIATLVTGGRYVWAPDGSAIAYAVPEELEDSIPLEGGRSSSLYVYDLETGENKLLVRGDETNLIFPEDWTDEYGLVYLESDWADNSNDTYWAIDPDDPSSEPGRAVPTKGDSPESLRELIPADLIESWAGQAKLSPDRTILALSAIDSDGRMILFAVNIATGDYAPIGEGDFFYWSPEPIAEEGE